jgi:hypothetical protein
VKAALFVEYLNTINFMQFDSYRQCYKQTQQVANKLNQDPAQAKQTHQKILFSIAISFHYFVSLLGLPLEPIKQNGGKPVYDIADMFRIYSKQRLHIRATSIFNQLLKSSTLEQTLITDMNQESYKNQMSDLEVLATVARSLTEQPCIDLNM